MMPPQISLFASAARPQFWNRLYQSLKGNTCSWELCFVGPNPPTFTLPENFKYMQSNVKPAQAYQAAALMCAGEVIGWTADDANYNEPSLTCPTSLDYIWKAYQESQNEFDDNKTILAQRPFEDGADIWNRHRFFHGNADTPMMAPLGFLNREWFMKLGGYDKNFICGQSENDIVMRGLADGGRVKVVMESKMYLHHSQCHGAYSFRAGYDTDRKFLEECWVKEGYGTYEGRRPFTLSRNRLKPFEGFNPENILTTTQGPAGKWA